MDWKPKRNEFLGLVNNEKSCFKFQSVISEFTLKSFALHSDYLEIIEKCYLPNAIKNLTPTIVLKYKYVDIKEDLKIKN